MSIQQLLLIIVCTTVIFSCNTTTDKQTDNDNKIKYKGKYEEFYENGNTRTIVYLDENKKKHGKYIKWNEDGVKVDECDYIHGKLHGKCVSWHANSQIAREGYYEEGELHGKVTTWSMSGKVLTTEHYEHGKLVRTEKDASADEPASYP